MSDNEAKNVGIDLEKRDLKLGTPETLNQAVRYGMMIGPMSKMDESIEAHVRDFIAQKFQSAILQAVKNPNLETGSQIESALMRVFQAITAVK